MKLTIELDSNDESFDRVIQAITGGQVSTPMTEVEEQVRETVKDAEESSADEKPSEEMTDEPRVYGEPGPGRKRRSKEEKAEDDEIDSLAEKTSLAITTDKPATELLEEMREEAEKASDEDFELDDTPEEMSAEEFRAMAIGYNKKYGKDVNALLAKYGRGLSQIPADKYNEVKAKLQETFGDA